MRTKIIDILSLRNYDCRGVDNNWWADSGATRHMTYCQMNLVSLVGLLILIIILGEGNCRVVHGKSCSI